MLELWFGVSDRVGPAAYAASGFGLMLLKYGTEAAAIWRLAGNVLSPLDFLNPALGTRMAIMRRGPCGCPGRFFFGRCPFCGLPCR